MAEQEEINRANFAGRLHPAQYRRVMAGTAFGFVILYLALFCFVAGRFAGSNPNAVGGPVWTLIIGLPLLLWGLWLMGRPLLEVFRRRVTSVSGWTNIQVEDKPQITYTSGMKPDMRKERGVYLVNIGTQTFSVDRDLYVLVEPDRENTAFLVLPSRRPVSIVPTEQR
jgi:hypothetical protein